MPLKWIRERMLLKKANNSLNLTSTRTDRPRCKEEPERNKMERNKLRVRLITRLLRLKSCSFIWTIFRSCNSKPRLTRRKTQTIILGLKSSRNFWLWRRGRETSMVSKLVSMSSNTHPLKQIVEFIKLVSSKKQCRLVSILKTKWLELWVLLTKLTTQEWVLPLKQITITT